MLLRLEKTFFYLLVFCLPLQVRHIFYSFGQGFNEWLTLSLFVTDLLLLAVLWLWFWRSGKKLFYQERRSFSWQRPEVFLALFILVSLFSIALAGNKWLAISSWLRLVMLVGLFLYIKSNFSAIFNLKTFWQVYVAGAVCQSLVAIGQFFKQQSLGLGWLTESPLSPNFDGVAKIATDGEKIIRAYGLTPHPNILAAILIIGLFGLAFLFFNHYRQSKIWEKIAGVFSLIILTLGLGFTFSRSAIVLGFVFLLAWLVRLWRIHKKENRRALIIFISVWLSVSLLFLMVYWPLYANRFSLDNLVSNQSANLRVYYNQVALDLIKDSPLLGIGQGNFVNLFGEYYASIERWAIQPVHNIYLLVASETGLLGLLCFSLFLFSLFLAALKQGRTMADDCFFYIFCFIILAGLTDHFWWDLQQGQLLFWLILGIFCARSSRLRSDYP